MTGHCPPDNREALASLIGAQVDLVECSDDEVLRIIGVKLDDRRRWARTTKTADEETAVRDWLERNPLSHDWLERRGFTIEDAAQALEDWSNRCRYEMKMADLYGEKKRVPIAPGQFMEVVAPPVTAADLLRGDARFEDLTHVPDVPHVASESIPSSESSISNRNSESTVERRMMEIFSDDQRCIDWTAREWAERLKCDPSAVKKTKTWKACMADREERKKALKKGGYAK